jgi:cysteine-rich repeat protein
MRTSVLHPALAVVVIGGCGDGEILDHPVAPKVVVERFEGAPARVDAGESATLHWRVSFGGPTNGAQSVTIRGVDGSLLIEGSALAEGSVNTERLFASTQFILIASMPGDTVEARTSVMVQPPSMAIEREPNDGCDTARPLVGSVMGEVGPGDWDVFRLTVPDHGNVWARVTDLEAGCNFEGRVAVWDASEAPVFATPGHIGICPLLDPSRSVELVDLPGGTYFVTVDATGMGGPQAYVLTAATAGPACGNGLVELSQNEQCDDGNRTCGDTCTSSCQFEADGVVQGLDEAAVFAGGLSAAGMDVYTVRLPDQGYITAEIGVPTLGTCDCCPGWGTQRFELVVTDGRSAVDVTTEDGVCPHIAPPEDAAAHDLLPAGTYFVTVRTRAQHIEDLHDIPAYEVGIRTIAPACGNGWLEPGEACDDANRLDGDGCSPACAREDRKTQT